MPLLGVCRGMQLLNVACGGTLRSTCPTVDRHCTRPGRFSDHEVLTRAGLAGRAGRRPAAALGALPPPPGRRPARRGAARQRPGAAGRRDRGDRAAERRAARSGPLARRRRTGRAAVLAALVAAAHRARRAGGASNDRGRRAGDRAGDGRGRARGRRGGRRRRRRGEGRVPRVAGGRPGRPRVADAPARRRARGAARGAGHRSRRATPASRSATRAARSAMVVETFRYYAGAPERLCGKTIPVAGGVDMTFREPLGVVGLIVPWNFPLVIASWKVAPALAAGNTIVLKPAELTPLTAVELERDRARGRPARGRAQRGRRARGRSAAAPGRAPRRGQDRLHRLDRGRARDRGRRRARRSSG